MRKAIILQEWRLVWKNLAYSRMLRGENSNRGLWESLRPFQLLVFLTGLGKPRGLGALCRRRLQVWWFSPMEMDSGIW